MARKSVLVVEDNNFIANLVKTLLKQSQIQFLGASSITVARSLIQKLKPDLIILDRYLPDADGHTLLEELRNDFYTKDIPVIMMSGENHMGQIKQSIQLGANDYVVKPFQNKVLSKKVNRLLQAEFAMQQAQPDCYYVS